jgi:hypothetical protein
MTDTYTLKDNAPPDPFAALWQSGGEIDIEPLVHRLQRQNRRLRQINLLSFLICIATLLVLLFIADC